MKVKKQSKKEKRSSESKEKEKRTCWCAYVHVSRNYPDRDLEGKSKEKKIKWRGWRMMASYVGKKGKGLKLQIKVGIHSSRKRRKKNGEREGESIIR